MPTHLTSNRLRAQSPSRIPHQLRQIDLCQIDCVLADHERLNIFQGFRVRVMGVVFKVNIYIKPQAATTGCL